MGKVPLLYGLYTAHCNHYPLRLKPDDIWLLIVQSFSNHVSKNSSLLRDYFVNFEDKKTLEIIYPDKLDIKDVDKKTLEDFSVQINEQFTYNMGICICGIPYIILEGTLDDYQKIKKKS